MRDYAATIAAERGAEKEGERKNLSLQLVVRPIDSRLVQPALLSAQIPKKMRSERLLKLKRVREACLRTQISSLMMS